MRREDVKTVAMSDRLIIRLGEEWLAKSSRNSLRCGNYTSDRMRRAARLLLECRKIQQNHQTMEDCINVGGVDVIVEASQRLPGSDGAFDMKTPSVAKKLKDDLLRMADGKELFVIRE